jgi:DNA invertase Pin-like site-specific DNA recombinase
MASLASSGDKEQGETEVKLAVGYARVSLEEESIENQEFEIMQFAKQNNIIIIKVFRDVGVSGAVPALEREGFRKMLEFLKELPNVRTIVVYDLSRLGRDIQDVLNTYLYLTEKLGYRILSVKQQFLNFDPTNPIEQTMHRGMISMMAFAAEMERAFVRERTRTALAKAKAMGKHIGRKGVEIPIDKVKEMLDKGMSIYEVWKTLKDEGQLRYKDRQGREHIITYQHFHRRIKQLLNEKQ